MKLLSCVLWLGPTLAIVVIWRMNHGWKVFSLPLYPSLFPSLPLYDFQMNLGKKIYGVRSFIGIGVRSPNTWVGLLPSSSH